MLAIAVAVFFLYTDPTYSGTTDTHTSIKELQAVQKSYNDALDNAKKLSVKRDELAKQYAGISTDYIKKLNKLLPDEIENVKLIVDINNSIAFKYGMVITNVKFDTAQADVQSAQAKTAGVPNAQAQAAKNKAYGTFDLEFYTEGPYDKFINFLGDLEKSLRIVDINSIAFSSNDGTPQTGGTIFVGGQGRTNIPGVYKYDFKVRTYWLKQ